MRFTPNHAKKILKSEKGYMALDFVFAISLIGGAMVIALSLCLTLTVIEVTQYIAFSTSRAYYAADESEAAQEAHAMKKYDDLMTHSVLKKMLNSSWFKIDAPVVGDHTADYDDVLAGKTHNPLKGAEIKIEAKLLGFRVPFFGKTTSSGDGLKTAVNSFLGREPSTEECSRMTRERWNKIKKMAGTGAGGLPDNGYFTIEDNGC